MIVTQEETVLLQLVRKANLDYVERSDYDIVISLNEKRQVKNLAQALAECLGSEAPKRNTRDANNG